MAADGAPEIPPVWVGDLPGHRDALPRTGWRVRERAQRGGGPRYVGGQNGDVFDGTSSTCSSGDEIYDAVQSETLKYLFLLFSDDSVLPLDRESSVDWSSPFADWILMPRRICIQHRGARFPVLEFPLRGH
jgi:hypothetical protein